VEWLGQDMASPFLEEALKNETQQQEWRDLFGEEALPHDRAVSGLKQELFGWKKLPIDTAHFPAEFKWRLLNALSEKIDLEAMTDGLVIHSDNFHGLTILQEKLNSLADVVYIDPPYNTDASAILYKNGFKDSSYFSLLQQTVGAAHSIMKENGTLCAAIDDEELVGLRTILSDLFYKQVGIAAVRSNPAGRKTKGKLAPAHEYALFFGKSTESIPLSLEITPERLARYPKTDENGRFAWANFIRSGSGDRRKDRPKMFYPIFVSEKDAIRIPKMTWDDEKGEYTLFESPSPDETPVLPVVKNGDTTIEKRWQRGHERVAREIHEFRVRRSQEGEISIDFKTRMDEGSLPTTWWDKKEYASANYGAAELKDLFGTKTFDFAKSRKLVMDCIRAAGGTETSRYVVDFFPGSGTTFDAVLRLNQADEQKRKCILIEQGEYVYSVILPRIKKIAYTFDWKDGRPKNGTMNGLGVFFKYQRLEQYEEALENIAFTKDEATVQTALELDVYMPKYFLNFETQGSRTLVNVEDLFDPWNYTLRVWDGFTYDTEQAVDITETFNYLIGLYMQKCITREIAGKRYQFVQGVNNDNKRVLVVWRNVKAWSLEDYKRDSQVLKTELAGFQYDLLYINGQAHFEGYLPVEEVFKNRMVH
jgi:adenine-specific DNA-methyltransferase